MWCDTRSLLSDWNKQARWQLHLLLLLYACLEQQLLLSFPISTPPFFVHDMQGPEKYQKQSAKLGRQPGRPLALPPH